MPNAAADTRSLDLSIDCLISETSMNDFHYNLVDGLKTWLATSYEMGL